MANQFGRDVSLIGPYRLLKLIGFGPISRLYLVTPQEKDTQEHFALKLIEMAPRMFQQEHRQIFFSQEVDRFRQLLHRSLLPLRDAGIHEGSPYLVYPYVRSGSLADYLAFNQMTKMPLDEALVLVYQLGKALEVAHQAQIVHGNLKPSNIFLLVRNAQRPAEVQLARSVAALADFNIDALTRGIRTARLQSTIAARYMAPEQFWGALSEWSDQYGLACLAYELLTGKPVFEAHDFRTLEKMHAHLHPLPPGRFVHDLLPGTEKALLKALSKRVGDRYPTMQAFLTELTLPSVISESPATPRPDLDGSSETRLLIPAGTKLILPLLSSTTQERNTDASGITQQIAALPGSQRAIRTRRKQLLQDGRWLWLMEPLKTLLYNVLVVCSLLAMWFGELWSLITLLFLVLRNRQQRWQKMLENSAQIPVVRPPRQTSMWGTTLTSAWQRGIVRNRRRWKKVLAPAQANKKKSPPLFLLFIGSLLGICLCLSGTFLLLNVAYYRSTPRSTIFQVAPMKTVLRPAASLEPTPLAPTIIAQRSPTSIPKPTPAPRPSPTSAPVQSSYACQVHYGLITQWPGGFEVEFTLRNTGSHALSSWMLQFSFAAGQRISQGWNGRFSQSGALVSISSLPYNSSIAQGGTLHMPPGFNGRWQGSNPTPTRFTLNGDLCQTI